MCFFNLVEQHNRIRLSPNRFRELASLLMPDISRRRSDQTRNGMPLHIFGHIHANHRFFVPKERFRERAAQFCFSDAGRTEKQKTANGPIGISESDPAAADSSRNCPHRVALSHHAAGEAFLHLKQPAALIFRDGGNRNTGPLGNHLSNVFLQDRTGQAR